MVKIRLTRTGRKNFPSFRIVAIEHTKKRDGKFIEMLGHYNPSKTPTELVIDKEKIANWVKNGAQVSKTVQQLIDGTYKFVPYRPGKEKVATNDQNTKKEGTNDKQAEDNTKPENNIDTEKVENKEK